MKFKIISKKEYDEMNRLLKEACPIIKRLQENNDKAIKLLKDADRIIKDLQTENDLLKEAMRTKTLYVDFPATTKLHEDKNY